MYNSIGMAILAAGKGTRLKVDIAKALAPALGRSLIEYVFDAACGFAERVNLKANVTTVIGHKGDEVKAHLEARYSGKSQYAWQREQKGTADALRCYFSEYPQNWDTDLTMVICADTPLLESHVFEKLYERFKQNPSLVGVAATFETEKPSGYGRILRSKQGFSIIEEKDATNEQRRIKEVNSGVYILKTSYVKQRLPQIGSGNKSGEFYLTDLFSQDVLVEAVKFSEGTYFTGVNTLEQLNEVSQVLLSRKRSQLMNQGVMFLQAESCYLEWNVKIGLGTMIYPNVTLLGNSQIGESCVVESGVFMRDTTLAQQCHIFAYSYLENAQISTGAQVGPFARLRPETQIGAKAKIGNFVEIKKSKLEAGAKVSHLSYVGDAHIGENTNIGCGFITCNYDGANKHKTTIGKNTFVGSDCQVIAPLAIGDDAFVAAGSTITKDVPSGGFAIARSVQVTKPNAAVRFIKKKS